MLPPILSRYDVLLIISWTSCLQVSLRRYVRWKISICIKSECSNHSYFRVALTILSRLKLPTLPRLRPCNNFGFRVKPLWEYLPVVIKTAKVINPPTFVIKHLWRRNSKSFSRDRGEIRGHYDDEGCDSRIRGEIRGHYNDDSCDSRIRGEIRGHYDDERCDSR